MEDDVRIHHCEMTFLNKADKIRDWAYERASKPTWDKSKIPYIPELSEEINDKFRKMIEYMIDYNIE